MRTRSQLEELIEKLTRANKELLEYSERFKKILEAVIEESQPEVATGDPHMVAVLEGLIRNEMGGSRLRVGRFLIDRYEVRHGDETVLEVPANWLDSGDFDVVTAHIKRVLSEMSTQHEEGASA